MGFQDKYLDKNARMYQGNNVKMFQNKNAEMCPGNNVETSRDKSVAKPAMVGNNYSQNIHGYTEQPEVIIASPISILQNKFCVLFIVTSSFRLKQILVN